ncbi:hypothetical protein CHL79_25410 [Delftia acidovorans]|nr:hypothetical protein CHL79_25410 [Delftia acidovorans]
MLAYCIQLSKEASIHSFLYFSTSLRSTLFIFKPEFCRFFQDSSAFFQYRDSLQDSKGLFGIQLKLAILKISQPTDQTHDGSCLSLPGVTIL